MTTVMIMILWFQASPATTMAVDFETPQACQDAKDTLLQQLGKTQGIFILECVPKGEIRTQWMPG